MEHKLYGYIRVSTREQNEDRQVRAMEKFGVSLTNIICDHKVKRLKKKGLLQSRPFFLC